MKKILLVLLLMFAHLAYSQTPYWQQEVNFNISVTLNDNDNTLDAFETIEYNNNSPDTLRFIWFHLWPNAYKNDRTAFSEQLLKDHRTDFYFSKPGERGYINQLDFRIDGQPAITINDTSHIDIIKVVLPNPLPPGGKAVIATPFKVKLPYNFSRGGYIGNSYQVTQWFPKPAVYDKEGWHPMPYLDQGEFYSEFGNFDVEVTVPAGYIVAATGVLQDPEMLEALKHNKLKTAAPKTWHYRQNRVHDFAWFAGKDLTVNYDTVQLSTKTVDVFSFYRTSPKAWKHSVDYAKDGLRRYSQWLGEYPYEIASIVQGSPNENSGGMEYPTITLITTVESGQELDATIAHELGHNWFYSALANNERQHPWMDEGMNTFYQRRYEQEKYGRYHSLEAGSLKNKLPDDEEALVLATLEQLHQDQPIETSSENFSAINYGIIAYYKAALWMNKLEMTLGRALFDSCMKAYFRQWQTKHVQPEDFRRTIELASGRNLDSIFNLLNVKGMLSVNQHKRSLRPAFLFNLKEANKYNYVSLLPAAGFNNYDKLMLGGAIHNYQLPFPRLRFAGAVLYATGAKQLNYLATASYDMHQEKKNYLITPSVSIGRFSTAEGISQDYTKIYQGFSKVVPSIKIVRPSKRNPDLSSWAEVRLFFITEGTFDFRPRQAPQDTLEYYAVKAQAISRSVHQLSFGIDNWRALYPYHAALQLQNTGDLLRATFTGSYRYDYAERKAIDIRLFAGKIFYTALKTTKTAFDNSRYNFTMYGANGEDDYTYSNPFIDRSQNMALRGKQIMIRDGGFKYRSDFSSVRPGRTDNWLTAINLSANIPDAIDILKALPFPVNLKVFADVGTYAEAWKENNRNAKFLFSTGLQLPVFKIINVYWVLAQSNEFKEPNGNNGNKWWQKNITFSIDVQNISGKSILNLLR